MPYLLFFTCSCLNNEEYSPDEIQQLIQNEEDKKKIIAQAKFFRALHYYYAAVIWEDVPLVLDPSTPSDLPQQKKVAEIWAQIEKDLEYYAEKIDKKDGPAMASGVLSVLYARLGDREKAYSYFVKSYLPNSRPPFGVFSESANSNNPYFQLVLVLCFKRLFMVFEE